MLKVWLRCKFQEDNSLLQVNTESTGRPSGEIERHRRLLFDVPDFRTIIHVHPTYTIAAMYAGLDLQALSLEFPEIHRYTQVAPMYLSCLQLALNWLKPHA